MPEHQILTPSFVASMLSSAIAPVTLIGGISFLISIMAARYGRCIDRIRALVHEIRTGTRPESETAHIQSQIVLLYSRIRALRTTMALAAVSIFFVLLTVCGSFSSLLFQFPAAGFIASSFILSLILLVSSTFGLLRDILISLQAVKIEIRSGTQLQV
jgi:hypothetical protein